MSKPLEIFDHVYVINLNRRPERYIETAKKLRKLGIAHSRMPAVDGAHLGPKNYLRHVRPGPVPPGCPPMDNPRSLACALSHLNCVRDAQRRRFEHILILEDDCMFHKNFLQLWRERWVPYWKLLYLGATQYDWNNVQVVGNVYKANLTYGGFAYALHCSVFEEVAQMWYGFGTTSDGYMAHVFQPKHPGECWVMKPNLVVADVTFSDIRPPRSQEAQAERLRWDMSLYD